MTGDSFKIRILFKTARAQGEIVEFKIEDMTGGLRAVDVHACTENMKIEGRTAVPSKLLPFSFWNCLL